MPIGHGTNSGSYPGIGGFDTPDRYTELNTKHMNNYEKRGDIAMWSKILVLVGSLITVLILMLGVKLESDFILCCAIPVQLIICVLVTIRHNKLMKKLENN